jgi:phosphoribosylaminoimidazole-succinocarboxamide synthase
VALIGADLYFRVSRIALELYSTAAEYAATYGLIDEALTPNSSRYWPLGGYAPGWS